MSQENVELVRRMCDAFLAGDVATALRGLHEDVKWHGTIAGLDEGRTYRGHQEVVEAFVESLRDWERHSLATERFFDAGDRVVVFWHEVGRGRSSGAEVETRTGVVYRVRDHQVVEVHPYMDRPGALEAAGLQK